MMPSEKGNKKIK